MAHHNYLIGHNTNPDRNKTNPSRLTALTPQNQPERPLLRGNQTLILSQKVCAGRIRTNAPTPEYNIQPLFRILPQHTVALRCAKTLELPQNGFLRGNQHWLQVG